MRECVPIKCHEVEVDHTFPSFFIVVETGTQSCKNWSSLLDTSSVQTSTLSTRILSPSFVEKDIPQSFIYNVQNVQHTTDNVDELGREHRTFLDIYYTFTHLHRYQIIFKQMVISGSWSKPISRHHTVWERILGNHSTDTEV